MNSKASPSAPILLVDDEEQALRSYALNLRYHGLGNTMSCSDSRRVPALLDEQPFSLVLLDLCMPHIPGEELLALIQEKHPTLPAIVITGLNEVDVAVRCMRAGSTDFLVKPVDRERLLQAVQIALDRGAPQMLEDDALGPDGHSFIVRDPAMKRIQATIRAVAPTGAPVLIVGETGAGKELVARAIHEASGSKGRLVAVNTGGLDDMLFADTLFGHGKGAFTSANGTRGGLVEAAADGTLFLDEIGDMALASQLKLLRLLQEKEYYPLGSDSPRPCRARIIAATNLDLKELTDPKRFRRDLFFRLRTHLLRIPPLRERTSDIPALVEHFLALHARELGRPYQPPSATLLETLRGYRFPGNVRELKAMLQNAVALQDKAGGLEAAVNDWLRGGTSEATTKSHSLPEDSCMVWSPGEFPTLKQAQERMIAEALRRAGGKQSEAARLLGITRQALNQRLQRARQE